MIRAAVGMETSGEIRTRLQAAGIWTVSIDILPADDGSGFSWATGGHVIGDLFDVLREFRHRGVWFDAGVFHPTCTFLTNSAAWAFKDPDFVKHPLGGYHQKLKPGTLTGAARRAARELALQQVQAIVDLAIPVKVIENPVGAITQVRKATQIVHPHQFGDDASKGTVLIMDGIPELPVDPAKAVPPRWVCQGCGETWRHCPKPVACHNCAAQATLELGKPFPILPRWANQTDSGQSNVTPSEGRWKDRSHTWPGIADAVTAAIVRALRQADAP
jgi:hypothetical protein